MYWDKRVNHVAYNDEYHIYRNLLLNTNYTSVTTLIGKYEQHFDEEYWSRYKALEYLLPNFKQLKKSFPHSFMQLAEASLNTKIVDKRQEEIKKQWRDKRIKAARYGTIYHKKKEDKDRAKKEHIINDKVFKVATTNVLHELEDGIYPELLVYWDEYGLSGQVDRFVKEGKFGIIRDYKTNEKLKFENKFQKMKAPLDYLDDCNMNHYYLQLNLYRTMIEKQNDILVTDMIIEHSRTDTEYKVPRMEKEIKLLLHDARDIKGVLKCFCVDKTSH